MNQQEEDQLCMEIAHLASARSHEVGSKQIGCVIVTPDHMMTLGWNGAPAGLPHVMREPELRRHKDGPLYHRMQTKDETSHAEFNALSKFIGSTASAEGSTLYCMWGPCLKCAILANRAKVARVVYETEYKSPAGVQYLRDRGVLVEKI